MTRNLSLPARMLAALREAGREGLNLRDLGDRLGVQTRYDQKRLGSAACELLRAGRVERLGRGVYRAAPAKPGNREVMWRFLRARRSVTVDDLRELTGLAAPTVQQWLRGLVRLGVVRREGAVCRLVRDPVAMPVDRAKADYLKERRRRLKEQMDGLRCHIKTAATTALELLDELEKEIEG